MDCNSCIGHMTGGRALHVELSAAPFLLDLPMLTAWIALHGTEGNERLRQQGP